MLHLLPLLLALQPAPTITERGSVGEPSGWPRFRGAQGTGVMASRGFPSTWSADENVAWSIEVPGSGWSSPVVVGGRVYVTSAVGWEAGPRGFSGGVSDPSTYGRGKKPGGELSFLVTCLSLADGSTFWTREVGSCKPAYSVHVSNTYATESPATDGERLFVTYGALGEVVCLDLEGEELWRQSTGVFKTGNNFGWGISLVTGEGLVFCQNDNQESSFLVAFDAASGEVRWRSERPSGSTWGTPLLWPGEAGTQLVAVGPGNVQGHKPSTGELLWRVEGVGGGFSASPTFDGERLYAGNSGPMSRGPLLAIPRGIAGTIDAKAEVAEGEPALSWMVSRSGPGFASLVAHEGLVYVLGSTAILACHDAATGERIWRERLPDAAQVVASPWIAGDQLFLLDETGLTFVLKVGREFELLHTNKLEGLYWGTPSVAGDALLVREAQRLHCIRG